MAVTQNKVAKIVDLLCLQGAVLANDREDKWVYWYRTTLNTGEDILWASPMDPEQS